MIDIHNMSVLITDDVEAMCKSIKKMMRIIGFGKNFFLAYNGKDAMKILEKEHIDLTLLDYNMPEMTGGDVLERIREDRNLRNMPVIMITGQVYKDYVAAAAESDIDAYIIKPISVKVLEEKISMVIEKTNNPPPMYLHLQNATVYEDDGDIDAAIKEVELAMEANPDSSKPVRELGYYYFKKDDLEEAEKWFLKAAEMNHLDVFAFHYLGTIYIKRNDIEKAEYCLSKAMEISPRHTSRGIDFGKILVQKKMFAKAANVFDKIIAFSGHDFELQEEIAKFCVEEKVNKYAAKLLKSLVERYPGRSDLLFNLGKIREDLGDIKNALKYLNKAGKIEKDNVDIKIHIARNYLVLGKSVWAENILKEVFKIDKEHEEARELFKRCVS